MIRGCLVEYEAAGATSLGCIQPLACGRPGHHPFACHRPSVGHLRQRRL